MRNFRGGENKVMQSEQYVLMTISQSNAAAEAKKHLTTLGLAFRLDELQLSEGVCVEIAKTASALAKHVRYLDPLPKGCAVYIHEIARAPHLGGWIRGHQQVEKPYWFPKMLVNYLRELQDDLDDLAQLKLARNADWMPSLDFRGGEI